MQPLDFTGWAVCARTEELMGRGVVVGQRVQMVGEIDRVIDKDKGRGTKTDVVTLYHSGDSPTDRCPARTHTHIYRKVLVLILLYISSDHSAGLSHHLSPLTHTHIHIYYNPVSNCDGI